MPLFRHSTLLQFGTGCRLALRLTFIAATLAPATTRAFDILPFDSFNQSPLVQIYGLPALGSAQTTARGATRWHLTYALSNNFTSSRSAGEYLMLDGETQRTTLAIAHGVAPGAEIGIEMPYVVLSGGFLDHFIEDFHRTFGFPDSGRPLAPRNRLLFLYQRNGRDVVNVRERASGLGDARLTGGYQLQHTNGTDVALRASLKLPTGDGNKLLGSGGVDTALWLSAACRDAGCGKSLRWYGGGGLLYVADGKLLAGQQRHWVGFGSLGFGLPWSENVTLKVQADAHTSFYRDSSLRQLDSDSVQLVMGGDWRVGAETKLEFALAEDVVVNTAPDVSFFITLRRGY